MFSVGTKAGSRVPYSHFDLVFGEDATTEVFPEIIDFIKSVEKELASALQPTISLGTTVN